MRLILLPAFISALAFGSSHASAADVFTLIKQKQASGQPAVTAPKIIPYSYIVDMDMESAEGDDVEAFQIRYKVNPQAEPGARVTVLSGALSDYSKDVQKELAKFNNERTIEDIADEFWCADDGSDDPFSPDGMTVLREDDNEAVISLGPDAIKKMMDDDDDMPGKVIKRMAGEMTVSKPELTLRHMKMWLTKPTSVKIVAKIKEMNIEQSCDIAPNGIPFVTERKVKVSGKALGNSFNQDMVIRVSGLEPL